MVEPVHWERGRAPPRRMPISSSKPPVVYLETAAEGVVTDSSSVVGHVALRFDRLRAQAESWVASRDLIRNVAEERWT